MIYQILGLLIAMCITNTGLASPTEEIIAAWFNMNAAVVEISSGGDDDYEKYEYELTPSSDARIKILYKDKGSLVSSTLMLISGQLLTAGAPLAPGYEIDSLDKPVLTLQLVNKLLAYATKITPEKIKEKIKIDVSESSESIRVDTTSASGDYHAPWSLQGFVIPLAGLSIAFELSFSFSGESGQKITLDYHGQWQRKDPPPEFPDSISLVGWKLYTIGLITRKQEDNTVVDYGATPKEQTFTTLRDFRQTVKSP